MRAPPWRLSTGPSVIVRFEGPVFQCLVLDFLSTGRVGIVRYTRTFTVLSVLQETVHAGSDVSVHVLWTCLSKVASRISLADGSRSHEALDRDLMRPSPPGLLGASLDVELISLGDAPGQSSVT